MPPKTNHTPKNTTAYPTVTVHQRYDGSCELIINGKLTYAEAVAIAAKTGLPRRKDTHEIWD